MSYFVAVMTLSFTSQTTSLSATSGALRRIARLAHRLVLSSSLLLIVELLFQVHSVKHYWVVPCCGLEI